MFRIRGFFVNSVFGVPGLRAVWLIIYVVYTQYVIIYYVFI